jgi:hypothetical protein
MESIRVEIMKLKLLSKGAQIINQLQPFFPNIKSYPLTNEVVFLITGPINKYSQNPGEVTYYYFTPLFMG